MIIVQSRSTRSSSRKDDLLREQVRVELRAHPEGGLLDPEARNVGSVGGAESVCGACVGGYGRGVTWAEAQPAMTMSCRPGLLQKSFGTILEELELGGGMPSIAFRRREVLT